MSGPPPAAVKVDPTSARLVRDFKHTSPFVGCRFDPTGQFVYAGAQDNAVVRFQLDSGKKTILNGHKSWIRAFAFALKEKLVFSGDQAGKLIIWPIEGDAPSPIATIASHKGWVRALATSPDGKTLASCGNDNLVKLWAVPEGKLLHELPGHANHVYNVAFHPEGKFLVSADLKGVVKVWDLAKGETVREMDAKILYKYDQGFGADIGGVRSMAFSPDGAHLACAGITEVTNAFAGIGKPLIVLFDWVSGKQKLLLRPKVNFQGTAWGVVMHPAGYILGVGGGNGGVLWAWKPGEALAYHALTLPNNARDLDLHTDGRWLAIPFFDNAVRIYDIGPK